MWPFDEEETQTEDISLSDFDAITSYIYEEAADPDEALGALRDVYSEFSFSDREAANTLLEDRSRLVREKFGIKNEFDYDSTLEFAPINFDEVVGEGDSDESRAISQINKWEEENKKLISESSDPMYIQNRERLLRDIEKVGVAQRRQLYGADNYLVTDQVLRATQGAVGPLASLVGADSVNDWFTENTDPNGATVLGYNVGGDDSYLSAISSGVGSAGAAIGAGVATGGVGALAYLGASGAGAAVEQYQESREVGGTEGEALSAAAIEGASQTVQAVVGGKIFGDAAKRIIGKSVSQLGTRVFPRIAGNAVVEGATESLGQGFSNVATNVGQGTNIEFTEGMDKALVAGFAAGGAGSAVGIGVEAARNQVGAGIDSFLVDEDGNYPSQTQFTDPEISMEEIEARDLNNAIEEQEMQSPPPYEAAREESKTMPLTAPEEIVVREDGTKIVASGDNYHNALNEGQFEEAYKHTVSVSPYVAGKLAALEQSSAPDGTGFNLFVEDGQLYLRSEFIPEDFATKENPITTDKTGMKKVKVPFTPGLQPGQVDVQANELTIKGNVVVPKYKIGTAPIKELTSAGAAHVLEGRKESQWAKRFRATLTPEQAEAFGLAVNGFEDFGKGELKETQTPLITYVPNVNKQQGIDARNLISEKGYVGTLAYLNTLEDRAGVQDNAIASVLIADLKRAQERAALEGNYELEDAITPLIQEANLVKSKISGIGGGLLQIETDKAQTALGGLPLEVEETLGNFKRKVRDEAETEVAKELGVPKVGLTKLKRELVAATEEVDAIEKEIGDPVELAKSEIDAKIALVKEEAIRKDIDEPIKKYEEDIAELKSQEEAARADINNQLTETGAALKEQIDTTEKQVSDLEKEISDTSSKTLEPTKEQVVKRKAIDSKIKDLKQQRDKISAQLSNPKDTFYGSKVKPEVAESRKAKANEKLADLTDKIEKAEAKKADIESEITDRTSQSKKPTSEATKKLNALKTKLTNLKNEFKSESKLDPKKSTKVKKLRSLNAERKRAIRDLNKKRKGPLSESAQKKITTLENQKAQVDTAQKEGKIKIVIEPETKAKLDAAKTRQLRAKTQLNKTEQRLNEKLAKFPLKDQNTLRELYKIRAESRSPTEQAKLDESIMTLRSKIEPITPQAVDSLYQYWRGNVLSGVETLVRNLSSFTSILGSGASFAATDLPRAMTGKRTKVAEFAKGVKQGLSETVFNDAVEILKGTRYGKLAMDAGENVSRTPKQLRFMPTSKIGNTTIINPFVPLLSIVEISRRGMSIIDTVASGAASNGHARVAALMAAEKGLSKADQIKAVENAVFGTDKKRDEVRTQIRERVRALESVGIKTSSREERIMFNEAMELNRTKKLQAIGEAGGLRSTYMNVPDGFLGAVAKAMNGITGFWEIEVGGKKIKPLRQLMPFVNTAANIGNEMLSYTPLGLIDTGKAVLKSKKAKKAALLEATKESNSNLAKGLAALSEADIAQKVADADLYQAEGAEYFGRFMVGTAFMVGMAGVLAAFEDDEKPWIKFNGPIPEGKSKEWASQNRKPFSLEIGDTVLTRDMLGPLAFGLAGADIINKASKAKLSTPRTAYILGVSLMGTLSSLSFLKNASELFESFSGSQPVDELMSMSEKKWASVENFGKSVAANYLQPMIPASGFLRNLYKWADGSPTETYNNFQAKMLNNIPYGRDFSGAGKMLNEYGEPIEFTPWQRSPASVFITTKNDDPVSQWRVRTGYKITPQGPTIKLNKGETEEYGTQRGRLLGDGYRDLLNEKESSEVLKIAGPQIKAYLREVMQYPSFSTFDQDNQEDINKEVARIRAEAREAVLNK